MSQLLKIGQSVFTETTKTPCKVEQFLGEGGQGEVYQGKLEGTPVAIKWYFPSYIKEDPGLRDRLEVTIKSGAPTDRFLWPQELVTANNSLTFGYVMPIREPQFKSLNAMMSGRVNPGFRAVATAGFELAHSYSQLHSKGLCYKDINFGNVFLDPDKGEIRVCDNDNVDVNGTGGAIGGTQGFMAPEVERQEAAPSTQTDLHSLAVLLFFMFMMHHPLEGKKERAIRCFDPLAKRKLYGFDPVFIFDPNNQTNAPVPNEQNNPLIYWSLYPQFLLNLFTKAFTKGLHEPDARVREEEWKKALVRLRDSIVYCGQCGKENFYDEETLKASGGTPRKCWGCQQGIKLPPRIRIGSYIIMLNHDTAIYPHHMDLHKQYDFTTPIAVVNRNATDGRWGLKNLSSDKWTANFPDGRILDVAPEKTVPIPSGIKINFGKAEGEIRFG
jgi:DNA-binding helix-hairpin-helix protein with protein kinase domain